MLGTKATERRSKSGKRDADEGWLEQDGGNGRQLGVRLSTIARSPPQCGQPPMPYTPEAQHGGWGRWHQCQCLHPSPPGMHAAPATSPSRRLIPAGCTPSAMRRCNWPPATPAVSVIAVPI
ncbi:hypothetical protein T440DRAFT_105217 [Plenodomus tracheiphilus IPT5]|uniref:Uncharacterized protein n=1 Tax=Plenodomus tracheiphilus IPT5 TaxID=1408161 RepID=A0A6A7BP20_9PLEO|nr:hypothetical protein T440DRAFT_105217 [Plenodomus tracheiphilus IPT5]